MNARDVIAGMKSLGESGLLAEEILDTLHSAAGGRWIVIDAETGRVGRLYWLEQGVSPEALAFFSQEAVVWAEEDE